MHAGAYTIEVRDAVTDVETESFLVTITWGMSAAGIAALAILLTGCTLTGLRAVRRRQ